MTTPDSPKLSVMPPSANFTKRICSGSRYRRSACANARTWAPADRSARTRSTHGGNGTLHASEKLASTIGTKATGTAAEAATACEIGYLRGSLHNASNVTGENRNGVRL